MRPDILVLMGSAGSGKGTQAEKIVEHFGYAWVETGNLIRSKAQEVSPLGKRIKYNDDLGRHAPDTIITCLLIEYLAKQEEELGKDQKPLLIDGFPRTRKQLDMLDEVLKYFDRDPQHLKALWFHVPEEVARERLRKRALCAKCKKIFASREIKTCDRCGGEVKPRVYDTDQGIEERLSFFKEHTMAAVDAYRSQGRMIEINAHQGVAQVWEEVAQALS